MERPTSLCAEQSVIHEMAIGSPARPLEMNLTTRALDLSDCARKTCSAMTGITKVSMAPPDLPVPLTLSVEQRRLPLPYLNLRDFVHSGLERVD